MNERIRWEGDSLSVIIGHVGTLDRWLFQIFPPPRTIDRWLLVTQIPGMEDDRSYAVTPELLKARAEERLEEFVSSLGAIFPAEPDESAAFQVSEARDMLALWRQNRDFPGNISTERALADLARNLLAIIDQATPAVVPDPGTAPAETE